MSDSLYIFKIIIAGDSGVGKTTLVRRYVDGTFVTSKKGTIGIDYFVKNINLNINGVESEVVLQIWDLAGEEKYRTFLPSYIPGTQGIFFVFSDDIEKSFNYLLNFNMVLKTLLKDKIPTILLRAKNDLQVDYFKKEDINNFITQCKIDSYLDTSAKTGENVNKSFEKIAEMIARQNGLI